MLIENWPSYTVPAQAWELQLIQPLSISLDHLRFTLAIFASVVAGLCLQHIQGRIARNLFSFSSGFLLVLYPFGSQALHIFPLAIVTYLSLICIPRHCGTAVWILAFAYLINLNVSTSSSDAWREGRVDFTGGVMVLVLKLISLACTYEQADKEKVALPNLLEYFGYIFGWGNLLSGPYIEFNDYQDFILKTKDWQVLGQPDRPSTLPPTLARLATSFACMSIFVIFSSRLNIHVLRSPWMMSVSLPARLVTFYLVGVTDRMRYYFAWATSEASLTAAGAGYEGVDAAGRHKWRRYRNARMLQVEWAPNLRVLPREWNIHTGAFLRKYVHERLKPLLGSDRAAFATLMVSSLWHGVYPSIYMFFASAFMAMLASSALWRAESAGLLPTAGPLAAPWDALKAVWNGLTLNYLFGAVLVLSLREVLQLWVTVYFVPHIVMLAVIVLLPLLHGGRRRKPRADSSVSNGKAVQRGKAE